MLNQPAQVFSDGVGLAGTVDDIEARFELHLQRSRVGHRLFQRIKVDVLPRNEVDLHRIGLPDQIQHLDSRPVDIPEVLELVLELAHILCMDQERGHEKRPILPQAREALANALQPGIHRISHLRLPQDLKLVGVTVLADVLALKQQSGY